MSQMFWGKLASAERKQTTPERSVEFELARMAYKMKMDRVQDPQITIEAVKMVIIEKQIKTRVVDGLLNNE